jgi:hypothetical protein
MTALERRELICQHGEELVETVQRLMYAFHGLEGLDGKLPVRPAYAVKRAAALLAKLGVRPEP